MVYTELHVCINQYEYSLLHMKINKEYGFWKISTDLRKGEKQHIVCVGSIRSAAYY